MALGLGTLRWAPDAFWGATPRELAAALEGLLGRRRNEPLSRADLNGLIETYPDEDK